MLLQQHLTHKWDLFDFDILSRDASAQMAHDLFAI